MELKNEKLFFPNGPIDEIYAYAADIFGIRINWGSSEPQTMQEVLDIISAQTTFHRDEIRGLVLAGKLYTKDDELPEDFYHTFAGKPMHLSLIGDHIPQKNPNKVSEEYRNPPPINEEYSFWQQPQRSFPLKDENLFFPHGPIDEISAHAASIFGNRIDWGGFPGPQTMREVLDIISAQTTFHPDEIRGLVLAGKLYKKDDALPEDFYRTFSAKRLHLPLIGDHIPQKNPNNKEIPEDNTLCKIL